MAEIINLRQMRKAKAKEAKAMEADANRAKHGTPKATRDLVQARTDKDAEHLDGHKKD